MSNQIQSQASKVWQTVSDPATSASYQQTLTLTWTILKETGYLLWLVVCLVLVFGEWIWKTGYRTGWATRNWINNFEKPSSDRFLSEAGKSLLEVGKAGATMAISTAKGQLGIEEAPEPVKVSPSTAPAVPAKAAVPEPQPAVPELKNTPKLEE